MERLGSRKSSLEAMTGAGSPGQDNNNTISERGRGGKGKFYGIRTDEKTLKRHVIQFQFGY